ncbi:unannotated protein [freshwater metagenome]|uniref:Unannotated protein n=1 Tax=freshwater metagenome TaxID=449393 RepID=A0A6J7BZ30_9ZZZZ
MTCLAQVQGQLASEGGLARALQTCEQDHGGRVLGQSQPAGLTAEDPDEFLVDNLDDLLGRIQRLRDLGAQGPLADPRGEIAHDGESNIGLEQRRADIAHGGVDIGLGQASLATQVLERGGESIRQRGEQRRPVGRGVAPGEGSRAQQCIDPGAEVPG